MNGKELPPHVARVLSKFDGVRSTKNGWDARCPCPDHNPTSDNVGDRNPSLGITLGESGRILIKCRVGCKTDQILETVNLQWKDLFRSQDDALTERAAPHRLALPSGNGELAHAAYLSLLSNLTLSGVHEVALFERGLSVEHIQRGQYRSLRNTDRGPVAKTVLAEFGEGVLTVPGFAKGEFGITIAGTSTGLLIPARDTTGRIQAVKIRRSCDPKYVYLSTGESGNSSGSPVHVPLGVSGPAEIVRVTEGELKADVCSWLSDVPTIGIPGVTQWRTAFPVLRELRARTAIIAFDAIDVHTKRPVFEEARAFWQALKDEGYKVEIEDWYDDSQGA